MGLNGASLHAPEAERALLGAILTEPRLAERLLTKLDPTAFHDTRHETLWHTYKACIDAGTKPDIAAVTDHLRRTKQTGLMAYLPDLIADVPLSQVDHYADTIADYARRRRVHQLGVRLQQQATNGTDPTTALAGAMDALDHAVREIGEQAGGTAGIRYIQFGGIFTRPRQRADWLIQPLIAAGRSTLLYSPGKAGKSLLAQEAAAALATGRAALATRATRQPIHVLYVDQEMTEDDWADRLAGMGYTPEDEPILAEHLHLAQMQAWPPMDTPAGGTMIHREATRTHATVVIIDTASKVIAGEENSNDTQQAFYRSTIVPLKRDGVATLILDHTGKDTDRGARGGSAKTDNIDLAFELYNRGKDHLGLRCSHARFRDNALDDPTFIHRTTSPLAHLIEEYKPSQDHGPGFRPTILMEKISKWLELNGGATKYAVERARLGKRGDIRFALELLVNEGYVATQEGKRSAVHHRVVRPYRHAEDTPQPPPNPEAAERLDNVLNLPLPTDTPEDTP